MQATRHRAMAIAILAAGWGVQPALAGPDDRLEAAAGAGYLAHQYGGGDSLPALVGEIGIAVWLNDRWGLAARYWRTAEYALPSYGWYQNPYRYHGRGHLHYSTLTGRYRVFLDNQVELILGVGALLSAGPRLRLDFRELLPAGVSVYDRSTRFPGESIDESRQVPWGYDATGSGMRPGDGGVAAGGDGPGHVLLAGGAGGWA